MPPGSQGSLASPIGPAYSVAQTAGSQRNKTTRETPVNLSEELTRVVRIVRILTCFSPVPWAKQLAVPGEADGNLQQPSLPGRGDLGGWEGSSIYWSIWLIPQPEISHRSFSPSPRPLSPSLLGKCRSPRGSKSRGESARSWGDFSSCAQNQRSE